MDFLKGKKTYILGGLIFLQAVVSLLVGDTTMAEFFNQLPEMLGGLGFMALRAGLNDA
jgi:hypothetical protein